MITLVHMRTTNPETPTDQFEVIHGINISVNGVSFYDERSIIFEQGERWRALVPLLRVLREMGATEEWLSEEEARITFRDKTYILSLKDQTLKEEGQDDNLIKAGAGFTVPGLEIAGNELYIDDLALQASLRPLGVKKVVVDRDQLRVDIAGQDG